MININYNNDDNKPESILKMRRKKILSDFVIQTCHLISARRSDLVIVNKKKKKRTWRRVDLAVPADYRVKLKESEKRDKNLDLDRELKKKMEHESDGDTKCNWRARYTHQGINEGSAGLGNERTSRDHPNCSIIEESWRLEESCSHSAPCGKTSTNRNAGMKNTQMNKIIIK